MRTARATFFFLIAGASALSQVDIGSISGTVTDTTDAVVPGVKITARNEANSVSQQTVSNTSGYYIFSNLPVGEYTIIAEATGFQRYQETGIHLNAADHLSVPVRLTVGQMTQTVEVAGGAAQALSLEPSTGGTVTATQMEKLEVNGRNPVYLALLEPGVTGNKIGTFDPDSVSNGGFSINGGRADAYTVYVDGAVATRTRESGSMLGAQDMNSVQEIQVLTGNFDAEYGRSSSGQIRFVTKSGTSAFHGDLYEALRNMRRCVTQRSMRTHGRAITDRGRNSIPARRSRTITTSVSTLAVLYLSHISSTRIRINSFSLQPKNGSSEGITTSRPESYRHPLCGQAI